MTIKRWVLFVLLIGSNLYSWGQWSEITTENTRISSDASTAYNSTLYGVTPDGTGGFIMAWVEREGNAAAMYVQRYDANANTQYINAAGKRGRLAFSVNGLSDPNCADGIKSVGLFRADGSNQAIIVYRVVKSSNAELYQQVINISDGAPQILANSGIGH